MTIEALEIDTVISSDLTYAIWAVVKFICILIKHPDDGQK
jgi:hypothetical protein